MAIYLVTGNQSTCGPGVYLVQTAGVTITLETWTHWPDSSKSITIKDATGSATPNFTVQAPQLTGAGVDNGTSLQVTEPNESLTFKPSQNGLSWIVT